MRILIYFAMAFYVMLTACGVPRNEKNTFDIKVSQISDQGASIIGIKVKNITDDYLCGFNSEIIFLLPPPPKDAAGSSEVSRDLPMEDGLFVIKPKETRNISLSTSVYDQQTKQNLVYEGDFRLITCKTLFNNSPISKKVHYLCSNGVCRVSPEG